MSTTHTITRGKGRHGEKIAYAALASAAGLTVAVTVGIFLSLLFPALEFFREIGVWDFLTGSRWAPRFSDPDFGVLPLISGTFWTTLIGLSIAIQFGLGAAVCLQYALGVATLLMVVPAWLGTLHQACAVLVLTAALVALHCLRDPSPGISSPGISSPGTSRSAT